MVWWVVTNVFLNELAASTLKTETADSSKSLSPVYHGVTTQKPTIYSFITMTTSNLTTNRHGIMKSWIVLQQE
jgi:ABC-type uncharacterized transport system permease subunit